LETLLYALQHFVIFGLQFTYMSDLALALQILIIGMLSVFVILSLVVLTGKLLIQIVNRMSTAAAATPLQEEDDQQEIVAIVAAVDVITAGKGRIEKIDRIK
jgi:oxaloacetate decarboxylase gamma subunit